MPVTTFNIDEKMGESLEVLRAHLGASSKAEVLKKAIALLKIATEYEADDGSITIRKAQEGQEDQKIIIK